MSDLEALYSFLNKQVDADMISLLVSTTTSTINVPSANSNSNFGYLTPPPSPVDEVKLQIPSLTHFISRLIHHSHVQTPTLMTSLIYLNKLKMVIPPNSQGIETTHHRIFLGSLILAAKFTNDSSPMNKHWTKYTDGLLSLSEVNALERELISFIGWSNLSFTNKDLIKSLQYFIVPIKESLKLKSNSLIQSRYPTNIPEDSSYITGSTSNQRELPVSISPSMPSLMSSSSVSTMSSYMSMDTPSNSNSNSNLNLNSSNNTIPRSSKDENLNIKLKPLRLSSNLKSSKSSLKLSTHIPLNDLSNSNNILSSY